MTRTSLLLLALAVCGVTSRAVAQDPVKLSPHLYKVLLENDRVRVLEFSARPGDKEPVHSHPAGVVYLLTAAQARETLPNGTTRVIENKAGETLWAEAVTHSWEHLGPGPGPAKVIIMEFKQPAASRPSPNPR